MPFTEMLPRGPASKIAGGNCANGPVIAGVVKGAGGAGAGGSAGFTWSPDPAAAAGSEEAATETVVVAAGACALAVLDKINPEAMNKMLVFDDMF